MSNPNEQPNTTDPSAPSGTAPQPDRREFVGTAATVAMTAGLAAGYGTLGVMGVRYLFPTQHDSAWLFVSEVTGIAPGESRPFVSPTGIRVTIKRAADTSNKQEPEVSDFIALSSVCPHLGCRVHWESQNKRFFCPCHNGEFDPEGNATGGPPKAAHQSLPHYPLAIENGLLFIEMPIRTVGADPNIYVPRDRDHHPHSA